MVRRVTPSQFKAMVRQAVNKQNQAIRRYNAEVDRVNRERKRAIDNYNREVKRHNDAVNREIRTRNQNAKAAVAKYNQAVRAHNSQVRADRAKLSRLISSLRSQPEVARYDTVRTSTYSLYDRFELVEREAITSPVHADLVALSEQESSNSAALMNTLLDEAASEPVEALDDTGILEYLAGFSQDLCDRWKGALFALNPLNTDAARHFCTSVREIFTEILERWAEDEDVLAADPSCQRTPQGKPTRRAKIRYLLNRKGIEAPELAGFVDADIDNIVELFTVFNEATHGAAGKHSFAKLKAIRQRVEGGIMFLAAVAS